MVLLAFPGHLIVSRCALLKGMKSFCAFTILCWMPAWSALAQGIREGGTINGSSIDSKDLRPLPGVRELVSEIRKGTISDADGEFSLAGLPAGSYTLTCSFVGYAKYTLTVGTDGQALHVGPVSMGEEVCSLDEISITSGRFSIIGDAPLSRQPLAENDIKNMSWAEDITRAMAGLPGISSSVEF